jgi:hypothetical protein
LRIFFRSNATAHDLAGNYRFDFHKNLSAETNLQNIDKSKLILIRNFYDFEITKNGNTTCIDLRNNQQVRELIDGLYMFYGYNESTINKVISRIKDNIYKPTSDKKNFYNNLYGAHANYYSFKGAKRMFHIREDNSLLEIIKFHNEKWNNQIDFQIDETYFQKNIEIFIKDDNIFDDILCAG